MLLVKFCFLIQSRKYVKIDVTDVLNRVAE